MDETKSCRQVRLLSDGLPEAFQDGTGGNGRGCYVDDGGSDY